MKKQIHLYLVLIFLMGLLCFPALGQPLQRKKPQYLSNREYQKYIINNFNGSIEVSQGMGVGDSSFQRAGGIVIGYYLHKYHHKPLSKAEQARRQGQYVYNHFTKRREWEAPGQDNTREGEANISIEAGIQLPQQAKWKPLPNDQFVILERFVNIPIGLKWTIPNTIWGWDAFYANTFGCMIRYLQSSTYITDTKASLSIADKLPIGKPGQTIDLKRYLP